MAVDTSRASAAAIPAEPASAAWRKMVGIALLWTSLATLVFVARAPADAAIAFVAMAGFASFAAGLWLFADGVKRSIVAAVRDERHA
jgi:hypothetical protein